MRDREAVKDKESGYRNREEREREKHSLTERKRYKYIAYCERGRQAEGHKDSKREIEANTEDEILRNRKKESN